MGGGITVGVHDCGRVTDVNNGLHGEGTSARSAREPFLRVIWWRCVFRQVFKSRYDEKLVGTGGLSGYLGTTDAVKVEKRIQVGDEHARLIYDAMAYQVAKKSGRQAPY